MKTKEKWYDNEMLLWQLIVVPPIFFIGLYYNNKIPVSIKKIITISFLISLTLVIVYFLNQ